MTGYVDVSAALFDDAIDHRQSEPGAFADLFGGEKRLEDASLCFRVHSTARVMDAQSDIRADVSASMLIDIDLIELYIGCLDRQCAAVRHGISGIERQIQYHLFDLHRIGLNLADRPRCIDDCDGLADQSAQHGHEIGDDCIEINRAWL